MPLLQALHGLVANAIVLYLLLVGLWGLGGWVRGSGLTRNYAGALVVGQVVLVTQGLTGMVIVALGVIPRDGMHFLYGIAAALGLPLAFVYLRGREDRPALLFYSLAALFVFGLALRAVTTAG